MDRRKDIRKRAAQLCREEKTFAYRIFSSLFSLVMLILCCAAVVLCERIYAADGFEPLKDKVVQISTSLNLNQLKQWLFLEKWIDEKTLPVSSVSYQLIEGQYYETDQHEVTSIDDGIVIFTGTQDSGQLIMVRQDNGLIVTYGLLNEVYVFEDDRVNAGVLIGKAEAEVYLDFSYQGESMSYEEALAFQP